MVEKKLKYWKSHSLLFLFMYVKSRIDFKLKKEKALKKPKASIAQSKVLNASD